MVKLDFHQSHVAYFSMLAKGKLVMWSCPITHIHSKIGWALPMTQTSTKYYENQLDRFCTNHMASVNFLFK